MALDPEEFKRRRQERQQKQQARQRRSVVKLVAAGIALALCGVVIFTVIRSARQNIAPTDPETSASDAIQDSQTAPSGAPPTTVIHLAAAGDLNVTDTVVTSGGGSYDYSQTFLDVAHVLADADITALNFEGTLYGEPYGTSSSSAPQTLMTALSASGVDLLQLANSYSITQGLSGLISTIQGVKNAGIEPLGVYASSQEFKEAKGYTIRYVQGVKIAFVAFTKGMDGLALPANAENCVNVLYTDYASTYQEVDTNGITAVLKAVEKEKPDLTVAMLHWGSEFNDTISESQNDICSLMQANGVDAIIGTHSHYVQKMDYDPDAGTFVAYSLGDFCGDAARAGSEYSVILDLEITKDNTTGETKITGYSYTPIFTAVEEGKPMRVLRINQAVAAYEAGYIDRVSQSNYEAMKYALKRIAARIEGN